MIFRLLKSGYQKLKTALAKTGSLLGDKIRALFGAKIDAETLDELEKLLYESDLGVQAATELTDGVKKAFAKNPQMTTDDILALLREEMLASLSGQSHDLVEVKEGPLVLLIVGVNGNGKTTSVAKLSKKFADDN